MDGLDRLLIGLGYKPDDFSHLERYDKTYVIEHDAKRMREMGIDNDKNFLK